MNNMQDSMSYPGGTDAQMEVPAWKNILSAICAALLALLFLVSGTWKLSDPISAAARMAQAQVPAALSLAAALGFGIAEVFTGILLLVPRYRRWGAWLCSSLLVAFLVYMAVYYNVLRGEDCSCFPWIQRVVGPAFFLSDGIMLVMALIAGWWAKPSRSPLGALVTLGAVIVFAGVCYGVAAVRETGVQAPATILVEGKAFSLHQGKVFLYFFDPECSHCERAAREMGRYHWKNVTLIAIPTRMPQFAADFLRATGFPARLSEDVAALRKVFQFGDPPYGVLLENGRQKMAIAIFDERQEQTFRQAGFIE